MTFFGCRSLVEPAVLLINPKDNSITLEYMQRLEKALLRQQHANDDGAAWPYAGITPNIQLVKDSRSEEEGIPIGSSALQVLSLAIACFLEKKK